MKLVTNKKATVFVLALLLFSALFSALQFASAQGGLVVFINSDTTWSKANSPHTLTGPTVISQSVTLTIESGATVNLNGYTLYINETLKAIGSATDNIHFTGSNITFGDSATGSSRFENAIISSSITSSKPITFSNDIIYSTISVAGSSIFSGCTIMSSVNAGNSTTLSNNNIVGDVTVGEASTVSGNTINGDVTTGYSATLSSNTINGSKRVIAPFGGYSYTIAVTVGNSSIISHNTIFGGVTAISSTISDNIISGGSRFTDWAGRSEDATSALAVSGTSTVTSNALFSNTGGYGLLIRAGSTTVTGNAIRNSLRVAGDAVVNGNWIASGGIQVGDIYISAYNEIDYGKGNSLIKNNIIDGPNSGIFSYYAGGTANIVNNLIRDSNYGINLCSESAIQSNSIVNCTTSIALKNTAPLINYNNIIGYKENSLSMSENPSNINATCNWWGTTDTQTIGLSIHDFKYDLNLGTVNYTPVLTSQNIQAPAITYSLQVPSFPSTTNLSPTPSTNPTNLGNTPDVTPSSSSISPTPSIPEYSPPIIAIVVVVGSLLTMLLEKRRKQQTFST